MELLLVGSVVFCLLAFGWWDTRKERQTKKTIGELMREEDI